MAEQLHNMLRRRRLQSGQYLGEISALCFLQIPSHLSPLPYLLAGTGSQMLLYNLETAKVIESFQVFEGIRVHGITCGFVDSAQLEGLSSAELCFELAVFGEKRVKLFNLQIEMSLKSKNQIEVCSRLALVHSLPRFSHWVLDVSFLKEKNSTSSYEEESHCLAIGCSNNSVSIWDISKSSLILEVQSPEKCLLYTMRLWGDNLEGLQIASGTIYNQILIWKIVPQHGISASSLEEDGVHRNSSFPNSFQLHKAVHISRLIGHEGSIFRIVWSPDGSKLVSVSDDRSARIWVVEAEQSDSCNGEKTVGSVLFGHAARVWDCCMFGSLIMTAGEDCTCRVWGLDGKQLKMIKEHIGRGVWRCLYDPNSSLLITAGFDSAIKVLQLPAFLQSLEGEKESDQFLDRTEIITSRIPNSSEHSGLMDSKSEYVRCLEFSCEDTLYVATNNGCLYHVRFTEVVKWTKLVQVSEKVPIICMDLLSRNLAGNSCSVDDWLALGDGKGKVTIVRIIGNVCTPDMDFTYTWSAEKERQLLGTYWCRALGYRFIFTADPRGVLKLWKLHDPLLSVSHNSARDFSVSLIAEFTSTFGCRIMCVDASSENEVLVCGDLRGNLIIFPLTKGLLLSTPAVGGIKVSSLSCFKGAHGISSVSSISISKLSSNEIEICSTGADSCICHFDYEEDKGTLEFVGMKQVKELSLVESAPANYSPDGSENIGYVIGFASTDFIIWNLMTEAKVLQIPCCGWRRPLSYYLGDVPEMTTYFAYVKDKIIYFHRLLLIQQKEMRIFPQNLHIQFHGREVHSLCFVSKNTPIEGNAKSGYFDKSRWIATGCEDGTVRLTRYIPGVDSWYSSKLLGEHVGGSAVRSICFVSKMHIISSDISNLYDWRSKQEERDNPFLLISVGAKRVLTSWLLRDRGLDKKAHPLIEHEGDDNENGYLAHMGASSSMSFKWLSTDMPAKNSSTLRKAKNMEKIGGLHETIASMEAEAKSRAPLQEQRETELKSSPNDEDDWRYMAVTAFLVKCTGSRLTFCFTVVACSDATLALRALVLPHRLWFDVALLVPLSSPVLALQHVIIPTHLPSGESTGNVYLVISGATDGSIAFWNLSDCIESCVRQLSSLDTEKLVNCPTRPRTGRGSQGGRWWKSISHHKVKKENIDDLAQSEKSTNCLSVDQAMVRPSSNDAESCTTESSQAMDNVNLDSEVNNVDIVPQICEIQPLHVFSNVHQSGVNCLHVSDIEHSQDFEYGFFFSVISGGDDQALHCLRFGILLLSTGEGSEIVQTDIIDASKIMNKSIYFGQYQTSKCRIRLAYHDKVTSAHSSAIKGVWTDGTWVFTTGLDQRIRCWFLKDNCKLTEYTTLIISVPEPEALHARACESDRYEIVVAGRGMQMVDFLVS